MVAAGSIIGQMTERIVRRVGPVRVILFGSWARGEPRLDSDIDLLVVTPNGTDETAVWRVSMDAVQDLGAPVDIVVATEDRLRRRGQLVGTVLRPALHEGVVLYDATGDDRLGEGGPVSAQDIAAETRDWLMYAREDLELAEDALANPRHAPRNVCYLAQQAAEKALKAIYVFVQVQYPFTHNLDTLRDSLPAGWQVRADHPDLRQLSEWAVAARYPEAARNPTATDTRQAVQQARAVLASVVRDLAQRGLATGAA